MEWEKIAVAYHFSMIRYDAIQSGLINSTYKVETHEGNFIVQEVNTTVFKEVASIASNIEQIGNFLHQNHPTYLFTHPLVNKQGSTLFYTNEHVYRVFAFIENTNTIPATSNEMEAYEAAQQFAIFTQKLVEFDITKLHETIPQFHNLSFRFKQFEQAVNTNNDSRKTKATTLIHGLLQKKGIVKLYENFIQHPHAIRRVMHHDTKISNVLFDRAGKGLCVIDLDTIMTGFLFSDVGDMLRTYLTIATEEENDLDKIIIRQPFITAIEMGYLKGLEIEINSFERDNFYLFGRIMIYMQALRFLTDYLEHDRYYGQKREGHNLNRALNQFRLLQLFEEIIA
jgi:thiamine kinase-like enzyme